MEIFVHILNYAAIAIGLIVVFFLIYWIANSRKSRRKLEQKFGDSYDDAMASPIGTFPCAADKILVSKSYIEQRTALQFPDFELLQCLSILRGPGDNFQDVAVLTFKAIPETDFYQEIETLASGNPKWQINKIRLDELIEWKSAREAVPTVVYDDLSDYICYRFNYHEFDYNDSFWILELAVNTDHPETQQIALITYGQQKY